MAKSALSKMVTVVNHPLVQHKLTLMRDKTTSSNIFRQLLKEISMLLAYEVTRDLKVTQTTIQTPLAKMKAPTVDCEHLNLISILRAGNGLLDGILELIPTARVGHIGLYREPKSLMPVEYYFKIPPESQKSHFILVDPMLATGHSAVAAVNRLKEKKPKSIKFMCLLGAPEGVREFHKHHPDVPIFTAAIDKKLNNHGYIMPGLGDAGDRIYGTK